MSSQAQVRVETHKFKVGWIRIGLVLEEEACYGTVLEVESRRIMGTSGIVSHYDFMQQVQ